MVFGRVLIPQESEIYKQKGTPKKPASTSYRPTIHNSSSSPRRLDLAKLETKNTEHGQRDGLPASAGQSPHQAKPKERPEEAVVASVQSKSTQILRSKKSLQPSSFQASVISQVIRQKQQNLALPALDPIEKLKNTLSKYTRSNDRRMMVRTLENSPVLTNIRLNNPYLGLEYDSIQLLAFQQEISTGKLCINGVPIEGFGLRRPHQLMEFLSKLCGRLTQQASMASEDLLNTMIPHIAPSSNANDAFLELNTILGSPELVLQLSKSAHPLPTDMKVYSAQDSGDVHAHITTRHHYGLFRKSDLSKNAKHPWIRLLVSVDERVNFSTGSSVRFCSVHVYDKL